jgi:hypothetical protein
LSLLKLAIALQDQKRITRLSKIDNQPQQTTIATPSGWDSATGNYIATTPDGGKLPYKAGQPSAASSSIVVAVGSNSLIGFGDWQ